MPRIRIATSCPRSGGWCDTARRPRRSDGGITVRNDTGVYEGGEISLYYDPMIAKLVTHAPTRAEAIAAQADALDAFTIEGIRHNMPFLAALMQHPRWQAGKLSTAFIAEEFPDGFHRQAPEGETARVLAAVAAAIDHVLGERKRQISGQMPRAARSRASAGARCGSATARSRSTSTREGEAIAVRFVGANGKKPRLLRIGLEARRSAVVGHDRRPAGLGAGAAGRSTASSSPIAASRRAPTSIPSARRPRRA